MGNRSLDEFSGAGDAADDTAEAGAAEDREAGDGAGEDPDEPGDGRVDWDGADAGAESAGDAGRGAGAEPDGARGGDTTAADGEASTAPTSVWDPAGGVCAACGETVGRRWRDDAGLVCSDCKAW